ncbi:hypothetical protein PVAND_002827 [Polypedilum vanderplanki]|uniref:Aldose 1-epimerase n=1 Tax=Polypedilum vanderplanki TaxID=319348 RepID=A0A9J6BTV1_POLVA|nr:hypothetical protein PVAND_002827 [Polypedilum vanderplanki]
MSTENVVKLTVDNFGIVKDPITNEEKVVKRFTWTNEKTRVTIQLISYGAMITSCKIPSKSGEVADIVLGFDSIEGYQKDGNSAYIGSLMGRVANRIANGEFHLNGEKHELAKNFLGKHNLHGGIIGFDKFNWDSYVDENLVFLTHVSPDDYEGFPGTVLVTAACELRNDDSFSMKLNAVTNKPTLINMSNHSYFNLAGHNAGYKELYKHKLTINADRILSIDDEQIPTGEFQHVAESAFDFRLPMEIGKAIAKTPKNGFDHNFCITSGTSQTLTFVARVFHPKSGRFMEVYSDQPSVLFYTSNNLPDPCNINPTLADDVCEEGSSSVVGKNGAQYKKHGSFCLETQKYADAIHHENFPSIILVPGKEYEHETVYKFGIYDDEN